HVSPRAVLTWHLSRQANLYTSYAEGFRSGLNQSPGVHAVAPQYPPAEPDTLKNYEVGAKGSCWNGRVSYDAAAFYIDWTGVQQSVGVIIVPGTNITNSAYVNASSASGPGFEFGATVEPLKGLTVNANLSWNDLKVNKDVVSSDGS